MKTPQIHVAKLGAQAKKSARAERAGTLTCQPVCNFAAEVCTCSETWGTKGERISTHA